MPSPAPYWASSGPPEPNFDIPAPVPLGGGTDEVLQEIPALVHQVSRLDCDQT